MFVTYGDITSIRRLSGNISTTNVPDSDLTAFLAYSDKVVDNMTGKSNTNPWTSADDDWELVKQASNFIASARVRTMFADKDSQANRHLIMGENICRMITTNSSATAPSPTTIIAAQSYKTLPKNPKGEIYRSVFGTGTTVFFSEDQIPPT